MAKHKKGHAHTGKQERGESMHLKSLVGHDPMAHPSHHAENKKHGMHKGFAPDEGYEEGEEGDNEKCE